MSPVIQNNMALVASILFGLVSVTFGYLIMKEDGFQLSVGISYLDFYSSLLILVPGMAAVSYFFMSMGLGIEIVNNSTVHWLRYFVWLVTVPILVGSMVMLSQSRDLTMKAVSSNFFMILFGFLGSITSGTTRLIFFAASIMCLTYFFYILITDITRKAYERTEFAASLFRNLRNIMITLWSFYPVVWLASSQNLGLLTADASFIAFMILDLVSKIGFASILFFKIRGSQLEALKFW